MGEASGPDALRGRLFLYGTLRDGTALRALAGREPAQLALTPAVAEGWRPAALEGGLYPGLTPAPEARLPGVLAEGLDAWALARLAAYEGEAYRLAAIEVVSEGRLLSAEAFEPIRPAASLAAAPDWDYEAWRAASAPAFRVAAVALGALFDRIEAEAAGAAPDPAALAEAAALWPDLLGAALRARGEAGPVSRAGGLALDRDAVRVLERERPYDAFFQVDRLVFSHRRLAEGRPAPEAWGEPVERSVFLSGPAVSVLPYDPALDRVMLIEQFRAGLYAAEDAQPWSIEAIAGRIDREDLGAPDAPERTARREALEEAGLALGRLERILLTYASPGAVDESLVHFIGEADLSGRAGPSLHGLPEEGEDIRAFVLPLDEAMTALAAEEIRNAPAVLSLLWLARHRPRLRALWLP